MDPSRSFIAFLLPPALECRNLKRASLHKADRAVVILEQLNQGVLHEHLCQDSQAREAAFILNVDYAVLAAWIQSSSTRLPFSPPLKVSNWHANNYTASLKNAVCLTVGSSSGLTSILSPSGSICKKILTPSRVYLTSASTACPGSYLRCHWCPHAMGHIWQRRWPFTTPQACLHVPQLPDNSTGWPT